MAKISTVGLTPEQIEGIRKAQESSRKLTNLEKAGFGKTQFTDVPDEAKRKAGFTLPGQDGNVGQEQAPLPTFSNPEQAVNNFQNFAAALNRAVELARVQRNDATLDFLQGQIPPGSVNASTFTGLLGNINQAGQQFAGNLVEQTLDFQRGIQEQAAQERNSIRDLALQLSGQGLKNETINAVLAAPNLETAISMSNAALNANAKNSEQFEIREVSRPGGGESLVKVRADGTVEEVFTAPSSRVPEAPTGGGSSGGGGGGGRTTETPQDVNQSALSTVQFVKNNGGSASNAEQTLRGQFGLGASDPLPSDVQAAVDQVFGGGTPSLTNTTPSNDRDLEQARLLNADGQVQSFFLATPTEFRNEFKRKVATGEINSSSLNIDSLVSIYDRWLEEQNTTETQRALQGFIGK